MTSGYAWGAVRGAAVLVTTAGVVWSGSALAAGAVGDAAPRTGVPLEFVLFGLTLVGVAWFHHQTLTVALAGLGAIAGYKVAIAGFAAGPGIYGLVGHLAGEWVGLANLFLLLMGFALLARHFEASGIPDEMPAWLPHGWLGAFVLLVVVFVLSSFLDNIAAALIGGTMARRLFANNVHPGYVAALVAAANAGGAGSVVGDTTTTMMWIASVSPGEVFQAYIAAGFALVVCGMPAAMQQHRLMPIRENLAPGTRMDWPRTGIVAAILLTAIGANVLAATRAPWLSAALPVAGLAVWGSLLVTAVIRRPDWHLLGDTLGGTLFLLALVTAASMMPLEVLPPASWPVTLGLGAISAIFDNIPLTALALRQDGYDWGLLAYAVGFGGSMIWFGSSAGVAMCSLFPKNRDVIGWVRAGWHIPLAYLAGFWLMLAVHGWQPGGQPLPARHSNPGAVYGTHK